MRWRVLILALAAALLSGRADSRGISGMMGILGGGSGAPPVSGALILEDGASFLLLEDGSRHLCLEGGC
jgi:hypothetical protein